MAGPSSAGPWVGRSGRTYVVDPSHKQSVGGMALVYAVLAEGKPVGPSTVGPGTRLAIKLARQSVEEALDSLNREARIFTELSSGLRPAPCPQVYDLVGDDPLIGVVMEWCPVDLEGWWATKLEEPDSFGLLCEAMADLCRRISEYTSFFQRSQQQVTSHADIKPRNVVRSRNGRWLITDFGASKQKHISQETWQATQIVMGTENFISPEAVFNARKQYPTAMDTWSIGCSFMALLQMRPFVRAGGRLPKQGTGSHRFRSYRMSLVMDLFHRRPDLFLDRDLDPSAFSSPDRLPDKDRKAIENALVGIYGKSDDKLEKELAVAVIKVLDKALRIDPVKRYVEARELAADLDVLGRTFHDLRHAAGGARPPTSLSELGLGELPTMDDSHSETPEDRTTFSPLMDSDSAEVPLPPAPPKAPPSSPLADDMGTYSEREVDTAVSPKGASAEEVAELRISLRRLEQELDDVRRSVRDVGRRKPAAKTPMWVAMAIFVLMALQLLTMVGLGLVYYLGPSASGAVEAAAVAPAPGPDRAAAAARSALASDVDEADGPTPAAEASDDAEGGAAEASAPEATSVGSSGAQASSTTGGSASEDAAATEAAAPATEAGGRGKVVVTGAKAYLVGGSGKVSTGDVPAGGYELFAQEDPESDAYKSLGNIQVADGAVMTWRCGFGTCRRVD